MLGQTGRAKPPRTKGMAMAEESHPWPTDRDRQGLMWVDSSNIERKCWYPRMHVPRGPS